MPHTLALSAGAFSYYPFPFTNSSLSHCSQWKSAPTASDVDDIIIIIIIIVLVIIILKFCSPLPSHLYDVC